MQPSFFGARCLSDRLLILPTRHHAAVRLWRPVREAPLMGHLTREEGSAKETGRNEEKRDEMSRTCFMVIVVKGCWSHFLIPQRALCGGIPCSFLEPFVRSWSHFVGIYRQILTTSEN